MYIFINQYKRSKANTKQSILLKFHENLLFGIPCSLSGCRIRAFNFIATSLIINGKRDPKATRHPVHINPFFPIFYRHKHLFHQSYQTKWASCLKHIIHLPTKKSVCPQTRVHVSEREEGFKSVKQII